MRFLQTFLLALGCFALALQSNGAGIPSKQTLPATEYRAAALGNPDEALNDYHHSSTFSIRSNNAVKPLHQEAVFTSTLSLHYTAGDLLNYRFYNLRRLVSEAHAKAYRAKLIFPEHYHW